MNERITAATAEDLPLLTDSFRRYYRELQAFGTRYALNEERLPALLEAQVRSRMVCVLKAESPEGGLAGFLIASAARLPGEYLADGQTSVGFIQHVYVAPPFRRQGLAARLFGEAKAWFLESGIRSMTFDVLVQNEAMLAFCKKQGYSAMTVTLFTPIKSEEGSER